MRSPDHFRRSVLTAEIFLGTPVFAHALAVTALFTAIAAEFIRNLIGWPGLLSIVIALVIVSLASLVARMRQDDLPTPTIPISLLVYLGWAAASIFWSEYQWPTLGGLAYLAAFTILAATLALTRDTIQVVRVFGDVLRLVLILSIALETFSGILIDTPLKFLGIRGDIAELGPIQGILGDANELGIVAIIAAITFATELRTKTVSRGGGISSLALAAATIFLTQSPFIYVTVVAVAVAAAALFGLRRVSPARRPAAQISILILAIVALGVLWAFRNAIVRVLNAGGELNGRLDHWKSVWSLIGLNPLEGWGWVGTWRTELPPFTAFGFPVAGRESALNGYLDVWLQLGLVGAVIFVGLIGLAFVRSWFLAGHRRSIVYAWPALVLVALIVVTVFESSILVEYCWLTFVVCCIKAAQELSWRRSLSVPEPAQTAP